MTSNKQGQGQKININSQPVGQTIDYKLKHEALMMIQSQNGGSNIINVEICQFDKLYQNQAMLHENDYSPEDHDDHCFQCKKPEDLKFCGICFRAFHYHCAKLIKQQFYELLICMYCKMKLQDKCSVCQTELQPKQMMVKQSVNNKYFKKPKQKNLIPQKVSTLICTICYCETHLNCSHIPLEIMRLKNYYFIGIQNYVCLSCINGISGVRILAFENFLNRQVQVGFYFVNAIIKNPIHCFWISQTQLTKLQKAKHFQIVFYSGISDPTIERIIDFRSPLSHKKQDYFTKINHLSFKILNQSKQIIEYGTLQGYRFLVQWKSHTQYVWVDQKVVFMDMFCLKKFLVKCVYVQCALEYCYKSLHQLHNCIFSGAQIQQHTRIINTKKNKVPKQLNSAFKFQRALQDQKENIQANFQVKSLMQIIGNKKSIQIAYKLSDNKTTSEIFSKCIAQIYAIGSEKFIEPPLIIIIAQASSIKKWLEDLQEYCPLLQTLTLTKNQNLQNIKKRLFLYKYLFYPQFQILLTTYDVYLQEQYFISGKINGCKNILSKNYNQPPVTKMIILDSYEKHFTYFYKIKYPEFQKLIILTQNNKTEMINQIHKQFPNLQINKFNLQKINQKQKIFIVQQPQNIYQTLSSKFMNQPNQLQDQNINWTQNQMIAFQSYVFAFGYNYFQSLDKLIEHLIYVYNQQFSQILITSNIKQCQRYITLFVRLVQDWKCEKIPQTQYSSLFFFGTKRQNFFNRICKLAYLKNLVNQYWSHPKDFPFIRPMKLFVGKRIKIMKGWTNIEDFILCSLIIKYGFGNWDKILCDKDNWAKALEEKHTGSFQSYIFKKLQKILKLNSIIEERAFYCFQMIK